MFITFEGPDGCGKSTVSKAVFAQLEAEGYPITWVREPGTTEIGDQVREVLMKLGNTSMEPMTEFLLFSSSRAQLVREVLQPTLASGQIVISDRYYDSSLAYQGYGHELPLEQLWAITEAATEGLKPDLTFLLNVSVEEGMRRKKSGDVEWNRLDAYELAFHRRVHAGYQALVKTDPDRWVVVDAERAVEAVIADVLAHVKSVIG